jgi:hypothetical protein
MKLLGRAGTPPRGLFEPLGRSLLHASIDSRSLLHASIDSPPGHEALQQEGHAWANDCSFFFKGAVLHLCSAYMAEQPDPDTKKVPNEMVVCRRVCVNEKETPPRGQEPYNSTIFRRLRKHTKKLNVPDRNVCCQAGWGKGGNRGRQADC